MLIAARTAQGWTQRELAERLGVHGQQIQKYEATEFAGASLQRIKEIRTTLGVSGTLRPDLVKLPTDAKLRPEQKNVRQRAARASRVTRA